MSQILSSPGLLERMDVSSGEETLLILRFGSFELAGVFCSIEKEEENFSLVGKFDKLKDVFKIYEYNDLTAIIKYNNVNIDISLNVDKISIQNKQGSFILGLGAKDYEIKTF